MNSTGVNQTDGCLPYDCQVRSISTAVYVLLYVSTAAVVLLMVCGNLLIVISICHFKQLHTPTNMLILSLAVSDFLVGALVMPLILIWMIETCGISERFYCICFLLASYLLTSSSIYNVALIAVDRYFTLSSPFLYAKTVSVSTVCTVILCVWFLLLLYVLVLLYFNLPFKTILTCPGDCYFLLDEVWSLVDLLVTFVFPCAVLIILYGLVFILARRHATAIRDLNAQTRTSKNRTDSMKSERKAAKVVTILICVFVVCVLPYFLYVLLRNILDLGLESAENFVILLYLNSAINPVIYALFYPWFRKCVKLLFTLQVFNRDSTLMHVL